MTTTATPSIIKVSNDSVLAGDVFHGSFKTSVKGKDLTIIVSNHLKDIEAKYDFRVATKCKAGFITISDCENSSVNIIKGFKKNALVNIQVKKTYDSGKCLWFDVFTTKNNKWYSIDKTFLDVLTVGDMRTSFPDMCDMKLWEMVGAKTWADKAFTNN